MQRVLSVLVFVAIVVGCAEQPASLSEGWKQVGAPGRGGEAPPAVRDVLQYAALPGAEALSQAKIFLVAGGMDEAGFAQEVVDQRKMWMDAGFSAEQVPCYYTIPLQEEFDGDREQYSDLAPDLAQCYPASPKLLWTHLQAAAQAEPDFVYLYATSHGTAPLSEVVKSPKIDFPQKQVIGQILEALPQIDQYLLMLDAVSDRETANLMRRLELIANSGSYSDHLFTPRYLKRALEAFGEHVPKYVTVSGCYSGGFIQSSEPKHDEHTLRSLQNLSLMTASRPDRASFGCAPQAHTTVYGGVYNAVLSDFIAHPSEIPWPLVYNQVQQIVDEIEKEHKLEPASEPMHYINFEG